MSTAQEKEFALFGIVNSRLKAGLLLGLLSLSITANILLVIMMLNMQSKLYEKMLDRVDKQVDKNIGPTVDEKLKPTIKRINETADRVDTAAVILMQNQNSGK